MSCKKIIKGGELCTYLQRKLDTTATGETENKKEVSTVVLVWKEIRQLFARLLRNKSCNRCIFVEKVRFQKNLGPKAKYMLNQRVCNSFLRNTEKTDLNAKLSVDWSFGCAIKLKNGFGNTQEKCYAR